jgi:hypothetical protein
MGEPIAVLPEAENTATEIKVTIPDQPDDFPAGIYTVAVQLTRPDETFSRTSNELPFALAPQMTLPTAVRNGNAITLTVTTTPTIRPEQRAALLLGRMRFAAQQRPHPDQQTITNDT